MAAGLTEAETEKHVTHERVKRYRAAGADSFFRLPFALFGDWTVGQFYSKR